MGCHGVSSGSFPRLNIYKLNNKLQTFLESILVKQAYIGYIYRNVASTGAYPWHYIQSNNHIHVYILHVNMH